MSVEAPAFAYVPVTVGPYRLLLPAERVLQLWSAGDRHEAWHAAATIDLRELFVAAKAVPAVEAVYRTAAGDVMLKVDAAAALERVAAAEFQPLPEVFPLAAALFDAVSIRPVGSGHAFRLAPDPDFAAAMQQVFQAEPAEDGGLPL